MRLIQVLKKHKIYLVEIDFILAFFLEEIRMDIMNKLEREEDK